MSACKWCFHITGNQGFGPTIDSCGPFGCLPASNNTNIGAGGLGGHLSQTNTGGAGTGGAGMGPYSGQGTGQGSHGPFASAGGTGSSGPFSVGNGNNSTAGGPFPQPGVSGTGSGPFTMGNNTWQSGSANGKGWATGGVSGPFSNGQGSGILSGPFHNNQGHGVGGQGGLPNSGTGTGMTNNSSLSYSTAPGTAPGGPFTMTTGTGDGLPYSPFSVAAGHNNGNEANNGPFAQASGSGSGFAHGPNLGAGQTPFGGQMDASHLTDGSGGILEPSVGSYSSMQHGSSFTWGSSAGQNGGHYGGMSSSLAGQIGGAGASGPHSVPGNANTAGTSTSSSNLLTELKDCPETLTCMKTCTAGYQLHGSFHNGCPACTCADTGAIAGTLIQDHSRGNFNPAKSSGSIHMRFFTGSFCFLGLPGFFKAFMFNKFLILRNMNSIAREVIIFCLENGFDFDFRTWKIQAQKKPQYKANECLSMRI